MNRMEYGFHAMCRYDDDDDEYWWVPMNAKHGRRTGSAAWRRKLLDYPDSPMLGISFKNLVAGRAKSQFEIRRHRRGVIIQVLTIVCVLGALGALLWYPAVWAIHTYQETMNADTSTETMSRWPEGKTADEYRRARDYNARIAASGQENLGEFVDPFSHVGSGKPASEKDSEYESLLNDGEGAMGVIRIPKISVKMPIYHGTSDRALALGAGHLYNTSLPVGGKSTNAVLSGHRGLPGSLLFTRLDELKKGDFFYVQTLGRTMGYRVTAIHVIMPDDTHLYKVVPGQDLVTLMTCTPYAVNTQRLIITGTRGGIPSMIPSLDDAGFDGLVLGVLTGLSVLALGLAYDLLRRGKMAVARHSSVGVSAMRFGRARRYRR